MAASDHLSPGQFPQMSVRRLMRLPSVDALQPGQDTEFRARSVMPSSHEELLSSMATEGQRKPVWVARGHDVMDNYGVTDPHIRARYGHRLMLGNGHHRIAVARQLGMRSLQVSADEGDTR